MRLKNTGKMKKIATFALNLEDKQDGCKESFIHIAGNRALRP